MTNPSDADGLEARAREAYADELSATAPKGDYVARTVLEAPSDADHRVIRAMLAFAATERAAGRREGLAEAAGVVDAIPTDGRDGTQVGLLSAFRHALRSASSAIRARIGDEA